MTPTGNYSRLNLSHKIKFTIDSSKAKQKLEDLPNQKISINLGKDKEKSIKSTSIFIDKTKPTIKDNSKPVVLDQQLFKQFKNKDYKKIDLHGLTVDVAHQTLLGYLKLNYLKKSFLHIVITGLGNKSYGDEFFTGKIRKQFPLWLETELFQKYVKSYCPCKIQHGGLGAFYIKLKTTV